MTRFFIALAFALTALTAGAASGSTREPVLAGTWYPKDPGELKRTIEGYLDGAAAVRERPARPPIAIIVPHAGYVYSGATAAKAFAAVRGARYERVVLIGPSHQVPFDGAALPGEGEESWRTPLGDVPLDGAALTALANGTEDIRRLPAAHRPEHSLEIEVPFLQVALAPGFRLVPVLIGRVDDRSVERIAAAIKPLINTGSLIVVSSDFTHYGANYNYVPFRDSVSVRLSRADSEAIAAIRRISAPDFESFRERTGSTICGAEPIRVLLTMLRGSGLRVEQAGYAQSGALTGDYSNSVSYAAIVFSQASDPGGGPEGGRKLRALNPQEQSFLLRLAREAIASRLHGSPAPPARVPQEFGPDSPLADVQGVFVTLTDQERLRGCIGSIAGVEPLAQGVAHQAVNSAFEDPRFPPLTTREMDRIHIEISVLSPPVPVPGPEAIVVGKHGVFIEKHGYRAVFLPQVATEQGWDRETLLRQLCRKAGLRPDDWKSGASFEVFEAQIFEEPE